MNFLHALVTRSLAILPCARLLELKPRSQLGCLGARFIQSEPWEIGTAPYLGLTPNVVFVEGWKAVGPNMFDIFYGAADSVVGTARVTVQIA